MIKNIYVFLYVLYEYYIFLLQTSGLNVQLKKCRLNYDLFKFNDESFPEYPFKYLTVAVELLISEINKTYSFHRVDIDLINANPDTEIIAEDTCLYYQNYNVQ